jgi:uncharacterized protein (TIGR03067 family)
MMRSYALALPCLMFLGTAPQDDVRKELAKFEGTWQPIYVEAEGKEFKADIKADRLAIAGKAFVFTGSAKMEGTIASDPSKNPPTIDTETTSGDNKGAKMVGIYEISKDRLMVCYRAAPAARPTEFSPKDKTGMFVIIYQRIK